MSRASIRSYRRGRVAAYIPGAEAAPAEHTRAAVRCRRLRGRPDTRHWTDTRNWRCRRWWRKKPRKKKPQREPDSDPAAAGWLRAANCHRQEWKEQDLQQR